MKRRYRKRRLYKNNLLIIIFLFLISFVSIGYAAFQTVLNINATGNIKVSAECVEGNIWEFEQMDEGQEFKAPCSGTYKVELWGASGGNDIAGSIIGQGGFGGFTSGILNLKRNNVMHIYVGKRGVHNGRILYVNNGGFSNASGSGGGSTDVRVVKDEWNQFASLKSRIMVAGAGGGGEDNLNNGGAAGGLIGYDGITNSSSAAETIIYGGSQISGYDFGKALYLTTTNTSEGEHIWGGGGNGYYSGFSAYGKKVYYGGGGGSSFISGHEGCDAIDKDSTEEKIIHTGQCVHYSGLQFTETVMIDGTGCKWTTEKTEDCLGMPTHDGNGTMTGNEGDGFAKITLISRK